VVLLPLPRPCCRPCLRLRLLLRLRLIVTPLIVVVWGLCLLLCLCLVARAGVALLGSGRDTLFPPRRAAPAAPGKGAEKKA